MSFVFGGILQKRKQRYISNPDKYNVQLFIQITKQLIINLFPSSTNIQRRTRVSLILCLEPHASSFKLREKGQTPKCPFTLSRLNE